MIGDRSSVQTSPKKNGLLIFIIILFHVVGLIGFALTAYRELFVMIVPFHLLLMLAMVLISHQYFNSRFILFFALIFLTGFTAEWVGVHTGLLFGDYTYGNTLGFKLLDIPLMIGVNWFLLVYATGVLLQRSRLKNAFLRVLIGAAILVLLDVLIEPAAMRFDYWDWANDTIPVKNYVCWFVVSAAMLWIFEMFKFQKQSMVAPVLLLTQFVFFIALRWV
ncbi:MAG: carotenoid biosynthesis protein [Sphingobacteriaceae bacterium]|nr:MAG: carotenoid biosynthesis protein [Sphingobacteriaceae bacterium]